MSFYCFKVRIATKCLQRNFSNFRLRKMRLTNTENKTFRGIDVFYKAGKCCNVVFKMHAAMVGLNQMQN